MTKIQFELKDCQDCPFCVSNKYYTSDSWEHAEDYWCRKVPADNSADDDYQRKTKTHKLIAGYIEWRREMPPVPTWCPIRVDKTEAVAKEIAKFQGENI